MAVNGNTACCVIACFFGRLVPSIQQFFDVLHAFSLLAEQAFCDPLFFLGWLHTQTAPVMLLLVVVFWHINSVTVAFWVYVSPWVWVSLVFFLSHFFSTQLGVTMHCLVINDWHFSLLLVFVTLHA